MRLGVQNMVFKPRQCWTYLLMPMLLCPASGWASAVASQNGLNGTKQANWETVSITARPLAVAEQEVVNERKKAAGKDGKEIELAKPSELQYPILVETADKQATEMLNEHLPLIVQQQMNNSIDAEQIQFLVEDTPKDAKNMLDTLGYFNATVSVTPKDKGYAIKVELGSRTKIESVTLNLAGPILDDEKLGEYYANAMEGWTANVGEPFLQDTWSSSKSSAVSGVRRKKYPLAKMTHSKATIDPAQNSAKMEAEVNSNQAIFFGELIVKGTQRYPESIVHKLSKFKAGDPYDSDQIVDLQNALEQDSHYSGVFVSPKFDQLQGDRVPMEVTVQEVPRQKFDAGLSYDSEEGPGMRLGYEHYNVLNRGYVGSSFMSYNKYEQSFGVGLSQPREVNGSYNTASINYKNSTVQKVKTKAWSAGVWHVKERDRSEMRLGLEHYRDDSFVENGPDYGVNYATMLTASWRYNTIETKMRPQHGYYFYGKVGSTVGNLLSSSSMQMAKADAAYYFTPEKKKYGTFIVRGQGGLVNVSDERNAPQSLLFRTGGANSVRGYEYESIGIRGFEDAVMGGKVMATASLEYQLPIKQDYALAVFHDVGGVSNSIGDFTLKHGTGIGGRWFSPFAPIAFDLAYGHDDQKIRWYIGLGTQF